MTARNCEVADTVMRERVRSAKCDGLVPAAAGSRLRRACGARGLVSCPVQNPRGVQGLEST